VLVEVRRGAGTCDAPCILGRVLDSTFVQARVKLSCSDGPFAIENKTKKGIGSKKKKFKTKCHILNTLPTYK
jgi:hypothetical protein